MWPREIFDRMDAMGGNKLLAKKLDMLSKPGLYILYRDEDPHYIGKSDRLRRNIQLRVVQGRRYSPWRCRPGIRWMRTPRPRNWWTASGSS